MCPVWRSQSSSQRRSLSSLGTLFIHVSGLFLPPLPPRIHTAFITEGNENGIYTVEPNMRSATETALFPHPRKKGGKRTASKFRRVDVPIQ